MTNLTATIDAYAAIKLEIGRLENKKKELEICLSDLKAGAYETDSFRLTISDVAGTKADDRLAAEIKAVLKQAEADYRATLSRQYVAAHTVPTLVRRHLVGLPTGKNLAA
jgi:hypothetical protein